MSQVGFNSKTPAGKAIVHILGLTVLGDALGVYTEYVGPPDDGGMILTLHPAFEANASRGERTLMLIVESLAGAQNVNLRWALDDLDDESRKAVCEAMFIAAGFEYAGVAS